MKRRRRPDSGALSTTLESPHGPEASNERPQPEQLVFPFQLRVGDVILEDGVRAEVAGRPTNASNDKTTPPS
jgi:hypothetical protein